MKIVYIFLFVFIWSFSQGQNRVFTIYFAVNSYDVGEEDLRTMKSVVQLCQSNQFEFLKIIGFADKSGSIEFNESLSKLRAESVLDELKRLHNLNLNKLYVTWVGESKNDYDLHFVEAHFQQRCVDILVQLKSD